MAGRARRFASAGRYRSWFDATLGALPGVPAEDEIVTRTVGPRRLHTSGLGDVGAIRSGLERVAFVQDSPLQASAALLRCARRELSVGAGGRLPIFLSAYQPLRRNDAHEFALTFEEVERLPVPGSQRLVLVDGVRGDDPASLTLVDAVLSHWPEAALAVACDRPAALRLRSRGLRIAPCYAQLPGRATVTLFPPDVAVRWFLSPGDPLVCPVADVAVVGDIAAACPGVVRHDGMSAAVVQDVDGYTAALARCFAEDPVVRRAFLRLDETQLASPVVAAVVGSGSRLLLDGEEAASTWIRQTVDSWDPSDQLATARAAIVAGGLADAALRSGRLHVLDGVGQELAVLSQQRGSVLAGTARRDALVGAVGWIAEGFDHCAAAVRARDGALTGRDRYRPEGSFPAGLAPTPVSVVDFAAFVDHGGYADRTLWPAEAEPVRTSGQPLQWSAQLAHPSRPVVGVSWYEAMAYAAWLSGPSRAGRRVNSVADRRAVSADIHPWGDDPAEPWRLNFDQHVGHATPVGSYPLGCTPGSHADLSGNVWEWCRDEADDESAVVMGGGWFTSADFVTSDYTYPFHKLNRFDDLGFRLAGD